MRKTKFYRKLDSSGRIVLPMKLRDQLSLIMGEDYDFYLHQEGNELYLCVKCAEGADKIYQVLSNFEEKDFFTD